jgi:MoxR-like ATPase
MSDAPLNMLDELRARLERVRQNVETVFLGKPHAVRQLLVGLLSRGHVLIDDAPGVGKTVLARALAKSLDLRFSRIQLTPDLLPSDLLGVSVYNDKSGLFEFKPGPIFANVVLADEINRTTPRTQSALLEAMNEGQVSMDGRTMVLDPPFFVIATQNPYEFEGTYYLPENQLDRFTLRIRIGYPARDVERRIARTQPDRAPLHDLQPVMCADDLLALQERADDVHVDDSLVNYALEVIEATREHDQLELGISPRGTVALMRAAKASALLDGRDYVVPDDLKALLGPVFAHRVVTKSFLQSGDTASAEQLIHEIVARVPAPA